MADTLAVIGALVATKNLTYDDAQMVETFCNFVDDVNVDIPDLGAAIDLALDFFCDDPETEEAQEHARIQAIHESADTAHERGVCPDCGEPSMMDEVDDEMSVDLWLAVRNVMDKYMWDQMHMHNDAGPPEIDDC